MTIDIHTAAAKVEIYEIVRELEQRINDLSHELAISLITEQSPEHALSPDSDETDELVCTTQDTLLVQIMSHLASLTQYPDPDIFL